MRRLQETSCWLALLLVCATSNAVRAAEPCSGFKWDLQRERALFDSQPSAIEAGRDAAAPPSLALDRLYAVALHAQDAVQFAAPPAKKMLSDGAYAGILRFRVAVAGHYRVSLGAPFWVDVVAAAGKPLDAIDFGGSPGCTRPHKVVEYALPAGVPLTLQLSGQTAQIVELTLTGIAPPQ